jgi:AcrR family transcriptional regulator
MEARTASKASASPKRLPPAERREQLIDAALSIAARGGYENLAFEKVANRAGVTRNLVYHYFPGGRQELLEAAAHRAGEQLSSQWVTDPDVPLPERLATNLSQMMDHAEEPTDAWLLYRQGRGSVDQKLLEIMAIYRERIIATISLNQLGTTTPPTVVRIALNGFIAYVETVLEAALGEGMPRERVIELVGGTLAATIEGAVNADVRLATSDGAGGTKQGKKHG